MKLVRFRSGNSSISIPGIPGMLLRLMIKTVIVFAGWRRVNGMHALVMFGSLQLNVSNTQVKNKLRFGAIYFKVNCVQLRSFRHLFAAGTCKRGGYRAVLFHSLAVTARVRRVTL